MRNRCESYVGISGVVSAEQQADIRRHFWNYGLEELGRRALLGVKATDKTQWRDVENKYGRAWYPVGDDLRRAIAQPEENEFPVAQIYLEPARASDIESYALPFTEKVIARGGAWLQGLQFDMLPWHSCDFRPFFDRLKHAYPNHHLLVQCHGPAMQELSPVEVAGRIAMYGDLIDYVLFDASHGTGTRMNPETLLPYLRAAYDTTEHQGVAVAGGLSADNLADMLAEVVEEFPDISWDAEGRLHYGPEQAIRGLDMQRVRAYVARSAEVLQASDGVPLT